MVKPEYKYSDITGRIIGCVMKMHQKMRNGYPEQVYHNRLIIEFNKQAIRFQRELGLPVFYEEMQVGKRRADFLVEKKIIHKIKAISELSDALLAQALNYLEGCNLEIRLLLNFGAKSPEIR